MYIKSLKPPLFPIQKRVKSRFVQCIVCMYGSNASVWFCHLVSGPAKQDRQFLHHLGRVERNPFGGPKKQVRFFYPVFRYQKELDISQVHTFCV